MDLKVTLIYEIRFMVQESSTFLSSSSFILRET